MQTRIFRLICLLSLTSVGVGSFACWGMHHPVEERREEGRDRGEHEHHDDNDHHGEQR
jgi:hypothetical protein